MGVPSTRWLTIPSAPSSGSGAAASSALSAITAAVATNSIVSSGNIPQSWSFDTNTDSTRMFIATETTASTGGTSTSGVPNQTLLTCYTLPASTMSPLSVYSRASHVFSISPSAAQILGANGTAAAPIYSFAAHTDSGMYWTSNGTGISHAGNQVFSAIWVSSTRQQIYFVNQALNFAWPQVSDAGAGNTGFTMDSTNARAGVATGNTENIRWEGASGSNNFAQMSSGAATAVGYAMNFRKSRNTVAAPTVITTGDDLATISGYGYDGTSYIQGASISFTTEGTISTLRVPGVMKFGTASSVGTLTEAYRINSSQNMLIGTTTESSTLTVNGGLSLAYTSISTAFTVTTNTWAVYASAPIAVTVTLPVVANAKGKQVLVKKTDGGANAVGVAKAGGSADTIEGVATVTLASQYSSILLHNDGLNTWYKVSSL